MSEKSEVCSKKDLNYYATKYNERLNKSGMTFLRKSVAQMSYAHRGIYCLHNGINLPDVVTIYNVSLKLYVIKKIDN